MTELATTPQAKALHDQFCEDVMSMPGGEKIKICQQCGTCTGSCPTSYLMDWGPREIIAAFRAGMIDRVVKSNTIWLCTSCYYCTVRCPANIDIAEMMYALKRYSMWKGQHQAGLIGPDFSEVFINTIVNFGRSYEPIMAIAYLPKYSARDIVMEGLMATGLILSGKLPLLPKSVKRIKNLRRMVKRIIPIGDIS
jgi:heterodisulfide reductase subunit C